MEVLLQSNVFLFFGVGCPAIRGGSAGWAKYFPLDTDGTNE
jgi:hypothetical protein